MTFSPNSEPKQQFESDQTIEISDPLFESDNVRFVTLHSRALAGRGDISVYAPQELADCKSAPVVMLLHGVYSSHWAWFYKGGAHDTARKLIAADQIRPMLLVAPSDGLFEDGSWYLPHSNRDFEVWIIQDVLDGVFRLFPCADSNSPVFLAGLSMGGYGALRLGSKHPHRVRGISAHSAVTTAQDFPPFLHRPFPLHQIPEQEMDLLHWMEKNRNQLPPLRFDCGTGDPLRESNRRLHDELLRRDIPHGYVELPGEHNWHYWHTRFADSLLFFEEILRNAGSG